LASTVVIGVGNLLFTDEGIGVHVVRRLEREGAGRENAEFIEAGTGGMKLVHLLAGRRKAVLVDCAFMGEAPGTLRRFTPEEARSVKRLPGFSAHEGDLLAVLDVCRRMGDCPAQVVILGIEPETVQPGTDLSACLAARIEEYAAAVLREI
jgi:hydrogenase maturation protease